MAQAAQTGAARAAAQRGAQLDSVAQAAQRVGQLGHRLRLAALGGILARKPHVQQQHVLCRHRWVAGAHAAGEAGQALQHILHRRPTTPGSDHGSSRVCSFCLTSATLDSSSASAAACCAASFRSSTSNTREGTLPIRRRTLPAEPSSASGTTLTARTMLLSPVLAART